MEETQINNDELEFSRDEPDDEVEVIKQHGRRFSKQRAVIKEKKSEKKAPAAPVDPMFDISLSSTFLRDQLA